MKFIHLKIRIQKQPITFLMINDLNLSGGHNLRTPRPQKITSSNRSLSKVRTPKSQFDSFSKNMDLLIKSSYNL